MTTQATLADILLHEAGFGGLWEWAMDERRSVRPPNWDELAYRLVVATDGAIKVKGDMLRKWLLELPRCPGRPARRSAKREVHAMAYSSDAEGTEFRAVLQDLASDPAGWQGSAGETFVSLMSGVLVRRASRIRAEVGDSGVMADPSDVVSEAVMVVDGPPSMTLAESARRILAMERPLGYVVAAVARNTERALLSEQMGVGARQIHAGVAPVTHYDGASSVGDREFLDCAAVEPAWTAAPADAGGTRPLVSSQFIGVLVGRFHVRAAAVRKSLEIASDVALHHDTGVGLTNATSRRRLSLFRAEAPALARVGIDQRQTQAMAWLLFGTERHPEWSLLAECARSVRDGNAITVSAWQARHARELGNRRGTGRTKTSPRWQPALFDHEPTAPRTRPARLSA